MAGRERRAICGGRWFDLYAEIHGERARATTVVLVEEVTDDGSRVAGTVLTAAMLNGDA